MVTRLDDHVSTMSIFNEPRIYPGSLNINNRIFEGVQIQCSAIFWASIPFTWKRLRCVNTSGGRSLIAVVPPHLYGIGKLLRLISFHQYLSMQLGIMKYPRGHNETLYLTASCINDIKP
ncbi:hypothetical protein M9H77_03285 [Catharanthus roseus]|uniref:Uncharacterized protein n=1 Tax=Catharanthus roseus TaxID=4058 RepID=A0ACC0CAT5_CATRO|nr:hypothetical protein M9H77_03285 [Catharanthus roseus]